MSIHFRSKHPVLSLFIQPVYLSFECVCPQDFGEDHEALHIVQKHVSSN